MLRASLSWLLFPAASALGVVYVTIGRVEVPGARTRVRVRILVRSTILCATWCAPLFVAGPGPAKLIVGLLLGFAGIRMVALGERWGRPRGHPAAPPPRPGCIFLSMVNLEELFSPLPAAALSEEARGARAARSRRALVTAVIGLGAMVGCVGLMIAGNRWRIWHRSRIADDLLVLIEVAIGAAGLHRVIIGVAALCGRSVAGLQDHPLRSASLSEFWGRRWNRLVQSNLSRAFFRPRGRLRNPRRGILAAFAASGVMHVIAVADADHLRETWRPAISVMTFFLAHAALVLGERRLRLNRAPHRRLPLLLARVRTLALFAGLSPLLLDPFATVVHVHGRSWQPPRGSDADPLHAGRHFERAPPVPASRVRGTQPAPEAG